MTRYNNTQSHGKYKLIGRETRKYYISSSDIELGKIRTMSPTVQVNHISECELTRISNLASDWPAAVPPASQKPRLEIFVGQHEF